MRKKCCFYLTPLVFAFCFSSCKNVKNNQFIIDALQRRIAEDKAAYCNFDFETPVRIMCTYAYFANDSIENVYCEIEYILSISCETLYCIKEYFAFSSNFIKTETITYDEYNNMYSDVKNGGRSNLGYCSFLKMIS